jgi:PBP1b-binding outer membrane lipoprotein LpoB
MIQKSYTSLLCLALTISSCSLLPTKKVEIVSKPLEIDIMQPDLPRPLELTAPQWWVVSEARIANPCIKRLQDDGSMKRPKTCDINDTENPDWPEGYTYLDQFLDEMKEQNNGEVLFVGTTIGDYKVMSEDMQELKRYINQLGEVVIYYREVTAPKAPSEKKDDK